MRRLVVETNVRGRDIGSFVSEAQARLSAVEKQLPVGYRLARGGQFENQQRAMARLAVVVPAVILLVCLLLFLSLGSIKSSLLVMTNLFSAMVGGILTIYRNDGTNAQPKLAAGVRFQAGGKDGTVPSG